MNFYFKHLVFVGCIFFSKMSFSSSSSMVKINYCHCDDCLNLDYLCNDMKDFGGYKYFIAADQQSLEFPCSSIPVNINKWIMNDSFCNLHKLYQKRLNCKKKLLKIVVDLSVFGLSINKNKLPSRIVKNNGKLKKKFSRLKKILLKK